MLTRLRASWFGLPLSSRWAVVVWVAVLGGILGRVAVANALSHTVVPIYRVAGHRWLAGEDLYSPIPGLDLYRNPPPSAAAFTLLTPLPEKAAGIAWRLLETAAFLTGLWRFRRDAAPELTPNRAGWMFLLSAVLAISSLSNGQVNLLLAAAALHGTAAACRGRWWEAAAWFGLLGWLKIYPLAAGMLAAVAAPRLGWRLAVVVVAGFALPFVLQDPGYVLAQYRGFVDYVGMDDRNDPLCLRPPLDWTTLPRAWAGWPPPERLTLAVSLAAAAAAAVLVYRAGGMPDRRLGLALVLGSAWMTVFGPATEMNTYSVLSGVAAYLAATPGPRPRWATAAAWAGYALLASAVLRGAMPNMDRYCAMGPQPVGVLLLAAAALAASPAVGAGGVVWSSRLRGRFGGRVAPAAVENEVGRGV